MTLMHVLGGLSLLILVAVATMVRAGIGFEHGDRAAVQEEAAEVDAGEVEEPPLEPVVSLGPVGPLHFGPLLDRMRP
ncbi:hypothetical protein [Stenotrophomonas rhizophila]|uniref:hypothetical protein n=1 Tax=Stenotrophomonas rhizophila TaxID=216778 RepID=UPI0011A3292F|nr:hypothetical protein [Stenotrophomonas rhizophila]